MNSCPSTKALLACLIDTCVLNGTLVLNGTRVSTSIIGTRMSVLNGTRVSVLNGTRVSVLTDTRVCPRPSHKHLCRVTCRTHLSHWTSQHQWKRHRQFSVMVVVILRLPLPQQSKSQPPTPGEVSLQNRPCVPKAPSFLARSQKSGLSSV